VVRRDAEAAGHQAVDRLVAALRRADELDDLVDVADGVDQALEAVGKQIGPWVVSKMTPDQLGLASETFTIDYRLRTEFDQMVRTVRGIPSVVDVRVVSEDFDSKKAVLRVVYDRVQQRRPMLNEIADRLDYKVR
jgi:hypothetical protein